MRLQISAIGLVIFWLALATPASAQEPAERESEIRTSATASRSIRPDLAIITLQFSATGDSPLEAGSNAAAIAARLRSAMGSLGIARDSMPTGRSNRWSWWWRGRVQPIPTNRCERTTEVPSGQRCFQDTTYRYHDAMDIRIHDMSRVGSAIDSLLVQGILEFNLRYMATQTDKVREELLREATRRAQSEAGIIAEASGHRLGRVRSLTTGESRSYPYGLFLTASAPTQSSEVVEPSISVSVTVTGSWDISE